MFFALYRQVLSVRPEGCRSMGRLNDVSVVHQEREEKRLELMVMRASLGLLRGRRQSVQTFLLRGTVVAWYIFALHRPGWRPGSVREHHQFDRAGGRHNGSRTPGRWK